MAKRGPKPVLNDEKKRDLVTMISVGISQKEASDLVGCDPKTVRRTRNADAQFAQDYDTARTAGELRLAGIVHKAAEGGDWKAAAWMLERLFFDKWGKRPPNSFTREQFMQFCLTVAEILVAVVPAERHDEAQRLLNQAVVDLEAKRSAY